jgi:hypothetical protein
MATQGIELIAQNTSEISAGIKEVIAQMKLLEAQATKNIKQVNLMESVFGSKKGFDKFITSLNTLGKSQALAFKQIGQGIESLSKSVSAGGLGQAAKDITAFTSAIDGLKRISTDKGQVIAATIDAIFKPLKDSKLEDATRKSISSINSFLNIYERLNKLNDDTGRASRLSVDPNNAPKLFEAFTKPGGFLDQVNKFSAQIKTVDIDPVVNAMKSISKVIRTVNQFGNLSSTEFNFDPAKLDPLF